MATEDSGIFEHICILASTIPAAAGRSSWSEDESFRGHPREEEVVATSAERRERLWTALQACLDWTLLCLGQHAYTAPEAPAASALILFLPHVRTFYARTMQAVVRGLQEELGIRTATSKVEGPLSPCHERTLLIPGVVHDVEFVASYRYCLEA